MSDYSIRSSPIGGTWSISNRGRDITGPIPYNAPPGYLDRSRPDPEELAQILWDCSEGFVTRIPWDRVQGFRRARYLRMANAVRARYAPLCCDMHGRSCEHGDLCCGSCSEAGHRMGDATRGFHNDGSVCVNPDLSPNTLEELDRRE